MARKSKLDRLVFVDTHGVFWAPCKCSARGAKAFGPLGCARETRVAGVYTWSAAKERGIEIQTETDDTGWTWVVGARKRR